MKKGEESTLQIGDEERLEQSLGFEPLFSGDEHAGADASTSNSHPPSAVIGTLTGFDESRAPLVDFPSNVGAVPIAARATLDLALARVGCKVVLVFEEGNLRRPIILGVIDSSSLASDSAWNSESKAVEAKLDGKKVMLTAEREITLRCGKASITLTRAGKILLSGEYLLSRSTGVNRIKGGSVQIN